MRMLEGGSVVDHLNEFFTINSQLSSMNVNFDEEISSLLIFVFFDRKVGWLGNGYE